mgnify:CR=1 FL=1
MTQIKALGKVFGASVTHVCPEPRKLQFTKWAIVKSKKTSVESPLLVSENKNLCYYDEN